MALDVPIAWEAFPTERPNAMGLVILNTLENTETKAAPIMPETTTPTQVTPAIPPSSEVMPRAIARVTDFDVSP